MIVDILKLFDDADEVIIFRVDSEKIDGVANVFLNYRPKAKVRIMDTINGYDQICELNGRCIPKDNFCLIMEKFENEVLFDRRIEEDIDTENYKRLVSLK